MIAAFCARVAQADQQFVAQGDPGDWGEDTTIACMDSGTATLLAELIRGQRIAALGTLREGAPLVSMVLYLPAADFSAFHVHVSRLAWHTQDMLGDPRVSLSIVERDDPARDPQTLARVSLLGAAQPIANDAPEFAALKAAWLERYPASAVNFTLADFSFFRIVPREARLVAGFGRIRTLAFEALRLAAIRPERGLQQGVADKTGSNSKSMQVFGVDFTSAPQRRKPITVACATLAGDVLDLQDFETLEDWPRFEAWLRKPGPWVGGFDFPFGLPREAVTDLGWPLRWAALVRHCEALGRVELRRVLDAYRESRPSGDKYPHRRGDRAAFSHSPVKLVNPPVALMFLEGAPRLLSAGVSVPGLHDGDPARVALEAYPGWAMRRLSGGRRPPSYKNDAPAKQTPAQRRERERAIRQVTSAQAPLGIGLRASAALLKSMRDDASGDRLDAVLCALQAAWGWQRRKRNFGLPRTADPLEGWIVSVPPE